MNAETPLSLRDLAFFAGLAVAAAGLWLASPGLAVAAAGGGVAYAAWFWRGADGVPVDAAKGPDGAAGGRK